MRREFTEPITPFLNEVVRFDAATQLPLAPLVDSPLKFNAGCIA